MSKPPARRVAGAGSRFRRWLLAVPFVVAAGTVRAEEPSVTIGAIYPLTGADAARGAAARAAIETAADIVNAPHKGLDTLPLGAGAGLPRLGGAKIAVIFADDQNNPAVAASQVLRLKNNDHVAALIGAGAGAPTLAATAEAEPAGLPFLVPEATDPQITGRGLNFVFRTTPLARDIGKVYGQFLDGVRTAGLKVDTVALVFPKTAGGAAETAPLRDALGSAEFPVVAEIGYAPNAVELSSEVAALHARNPDAVIFVGNAADAGLFVKTMKTVDYKPPLLIGDAAGFSDPGFIAANGNLAQGAIDRSVRSVGKEDSPTALVNALYKAKTGRDLDDTGARILQGFLVLAEAIDRAGATDPGAIGQALRETDLKREQLIVGYDGVKFDASGQNTLAATYLTQLQGKQYVTVWPVASATAKLVLPYKAWQQ